MTPRFTIAIPTIGRLDMIKRTMYSALAQQDQYGDYEIVVLDNCSEDGTWDYLQTVKHNPKVTLHRNLERLPPAQNWNKAARLSNGEYIYMLQDDDVALPNMLSTAARAIDKHEDVDLVCFGTALMDENEQNHRVFGQPESASFLQAPEALLRFAKKWNSSIAQIVFSQATFEKYGDFDEAHAFTSDAETVLLWMVHSNAVLVPDTLVMRRIWPGQVMAKIHNTAELRKALSDLVDHVLRSASESGHLDEARLEELRRSLIQTFIEPYENSLHPNDYLRGILPERYGARS